MATAPARLTTARRGARALLPRLALAFGALLLFSACIRADIGVRVNDDGSGTASVLFAFDKDLIELMGSLGDSSDSGTPTAGFDPESIFADVDRSTLPKDTTIEPYEKDGFVGARITTKFARAEDLPALLGNITSSVALPGDESVGDGTEGDSGFDKLELKRTEDGWSFSAVVAPTSSDGAEAGSGELTAGFMKDASFTFRLKLPGKVKEHNADKLQGGELVWDLDLAATEPRTLTARSSGTGSSSDGGGGFPWLIVGGVVLALVVIGGGAYMWMQRRKPAAVPPTSPPPSATTEDTSAGPPPTEPPQPPSVP